MKLKGKTLPAARVAELGNSDDLKPGDYAIALGNPLGLDRTITVGVISALGRSGLNAQGGARYQDFIQTDAQINPGNSGGALCDINGRVIGINDMYTAQYAGIGFAIPINLSKTVMTKLIATGKVDRGYLGIGGKDVDKSMQDALDLPAAEGVIVEQVVADSPADKAGLKAGNVILTIDGQKVKNWNDFTFKIAARNPGDTAKFDVLQDGAKKTVAVTLANRADYADAGTEGVLSGKGETSWRGIHVVNIDNERYKQYVPGSVKSGVLVVDVDEDSPAGRSQIEEGDIITEISIEKTKMTIKTVQDFESLHQKFKNSKRPMLIYRTQVSDNGRTSKGFVTVDAE
jgi:serine protease Do